MVHPLVAHLTIFTWTSLINDEAACISLLEDLSVIPKKNGPCPKCPKCASYMSARKENGLYLGWRWRCNKRNVYGGSRCSGAMNPAKNTFFEHSHMGICEILAIIVSFVIRIPINFLHEELNEWRKARNLRVLSKSTLVDYFCFCREITEVVSSHDYHMLGGPGNIVGFLIRFNNLYYIFNITGCTVEVDETFLTKRKYNRGRMTDSMTITVFGIFCRESKEGVFFKVSINILIYFLLIFEKIK